MAQTTNRSDTARCRASAVRACLMLALAAAAAVLGFIHVRRVVYASASLLIAAAVYATCFKDINKSILSVFKRSPRSTAFFSFGFIMCVIHYIYILAAQGAECVSCSWILYLSMAVFYAVNSAFEGQIAADMRMLSDEDVYSIETVHSNLGRRNMPNVAVVTAAEKNVDIASLIRDGHPIGTKNEYFIPACMIFTLIAGIVCGLVNGGEDYFVAVTVLSCIGASFTSEACVTLPYIIMQNRLKRRGSVIMGFDAVPRLHGCDTFILYDTDIFTESCISVADIQFRQKQDAGFAIEYMASALRAAKVPSAQAFERILDFPLSQLPKTENIKFIQNNGISCRIGRDSVLIGNRSLMLACNIEPLPVPKEASIRSMGLEPLYLGVNGDLSTVVMLRYKANPRLNNIISRMDQRFNLVVQTRDCNVTEGLIKKHYRLGGVRVIVPDEEEMRFINKIRREISHNPSDPVMLVTRDAVDILSSVESSNKLFGIINLSVRTTQVGIAVGLILTFAALFFVPMSAAAVWALVYNLIWSLPVLGLCAVNGR